MHENIITKIDRGVEFTVNNVRRELGDYLWVKKRTAERIVALIAISIDIWLNHSQDNILVSAVLYIIYMHLFTEQFPKKNTNTDALNLSIMTEQEIIKIIRVLSLFTIFWDASIGQFNSLSTLLYLHFKCHDNDDPGIKNWVKWKLSELKKSIKLPGTQPLPV